MCITAPAPSADPEENVTYWTYSPLGLVATETINVNSTDLVRFFQLRRAGEPPSEDRPLAGG